ncbi:MAG: trypsin-like peptidase domain-containing protein [Patescibacteria group bacterium]
MNFYFLNQLFNKKQNSVEIIKKVMPAVVTITVSEALEKLENETINLKAKKKLKSVADSSGMIEIGSGSGFIVDKDGIILTNKHIIADPEAKYKIITNDNEKFEAKVLTRDPINDVAILKIVDSKNNFPILNLGDSSKIEIGEEAMAFGNALGIFKNTVSKGIVSGLLRSISARIDANSPTQEMRGLIQTDAAINPGNSGGPLINSNGEAIGINTVTVFGAENIGLAIPINSAKRDLNDLKKYGRIKRPLLGIRYLIINENVKNKFSLQTDYGALIITQSGYNESIIPNSPADISGLKERDILLEINDQKITSDKTIGDFLENLAVGDVLKLKVLRGKKISDMKVSLAERK